MNILFINGSPSKNGNTAALAAALLENRDYAAGALRAERTSANLTFPAMPAFAAPPRLFMTARRDILRHQPFVFSASHSESSCKFPPSTR